MDHALNSLSAILKSGLLPARLRNLQGTKVAFCQGSWKHVLTQICKLPPAANWTLSQNYGASNLTFISCAWNHNVQVWMWIEYPSETMLAKF